ncbi:MAG: hypothetical protein NVS1B13_06870 [Flavisolibacter sp.]
MRGRNLNIIFFFIVLAVSVNAQTSVNKNSGQTTTAYNTISTVQQTNDSSIHIADPTIFYNKGTYYLYGTVEGDFG